MRKGFIVVNFVLALGYVPYAFSMQCFVLAGQIITRPAEGVGSANGCPLTVIANTGRQPEVIAHLAVTNVQNNYCEYRTASDNESIQCSYTSNSAPALNIP